MMNYLDTKFANKQVILGSQSPRRKELLKHLLSNFNTTSLNVIEEYSFDLKGAEITEFLCDLKASAYQLKPNEVLITADTIVWLNGKAIEKPKNKLDAKKMLLKLSEQEHEVISSYCIKSTSKKIIESDVTKVKFRALDLKEIEYYVETYLPLDKAGSYGIQEWIGCIGIESIFGSYYNVMGLPLHKLYSSLKAF